MDPYTYLMQFVNQTLRIEIHDERFFIGRLKCVDQGCNLILVGTHEYRPPTDVQDQRRLITLGRHPTGHIPYESRFVGLVVIPKTQQRRLELEQQASDTNARAPFQLSPHGDHREPLRLV
ncbi:lsm domain-containing protein [Venturia nashicola]|uniref:Lsm domain-containing protein n=1 Tax=Venturia nashicola TaxID=86259 RepID=A0A4Z1P6J0_9PEZI|nr:lsm domain-containing protein [Venturia nashicola]TLD26328.1 lsm domain-containing protein [Venturia nashicola]